jgi:hypothetical protein
VADSDERVVKEEIFMARSKKRGKQTMPKKKSSKRASQRDSQTKQPFEQDAKRRIGQYGGTGEPPIQR